MVDCLYVRLTILSFPLVVQALPEELYITLGNDQWLHHLFLVVVVHALEVLLKLQKFDVV